MQGLHQRTAVQQHGALVQRSLVRHFAFVDRRRLLHHMQPGDSASAARSRCRQRVDDVLKVLGDGLAWQQARRCGWNHQRADFLEVDARQHHVLHIGRTCCDDFGAQWAHADKGAGGQLEVFGNPAVKAQAGVDVGVVNPLHRIASTKKTFLVEGLSCVSGCTPVARRDVGAFVAHLGFAFGGHQLEHHARRRYAQVTGLDVRAGHKNGERP